MPNDLNGIEYEIMLLVWCFCVFLCVCVLVLVRVWHGKEMSARESALTLGGAEKFIQYVGSHKFAMFLILFVLYWYSTLHSVEAHENVSEVERRRERIEMYGVPRQHSKCKCLKLLRLNRSLHRTFVRSTHLSVEGKVYFASLTHRTYSIFQFQFFVLSVGFFIPVSPPFCHTIQKPANKWVVREYMNDDTWKHVYNRIEQKKHIHYSDDGYNTTSKVMPTNTNHTSS